MQPTFNFCAGDVRFLLTVFVAQGKKQAPLSPVDAKTMQRANISEVERMLENSNEFTGYSGASRNP